MAVNEENLKVLIVSLYALYEGFKEKSEQTANIIRSFKKIELVKEEGSSSSSLPIDADTGQTITQDRRDEIYDKCIGSANELLGLNQEEESSDEEEEEQEESDEEQ